MDGEPVSERPAESAEAATSDWRELITVVLLSVTAIATAWTGFQATNWGGATSIAFSQASTARIEAARFESVANRKLQIQVSLFTEWLQAYQAQDTALTNFLATRFPEPLASTFPTWLETRPFQNPDAPAHPFAMEGYVIPEQNQAGEADARADAKFAEALRNDQRGDNYTVLTIGFATVLFFAAVSGRMTSRTAQWTLLGVGGAGFIFCSAILLSFPKLL